MSRGVASGELFATVRWLIECGQQLQQYYNEQMERLQKIADNAPDKREWVVQQQTRLGVLVSYRDAAERTASRLMEAMFNLPSQPDADPYRAAQLDAATVLQWLEYEATQDEIGQVADYLSDVKEKMQLVKNLTVEQLRAALDRKKPTTQHEHTTTDTTGR